MWRGAEKANQPQTPTTIGPGGCPLQPHGDASSPPGRQATGEEYQRRLPAPQVSLFANFLMCPPTCLPRITSCLPPSPPAAQLSLAARCVCGRSPDSGRGPGELGGVYQEPRPSELAAPRGSEGAVTRHSSPRPPARRPRPGPARPRHLGSPV